MSSSSSSLNRPAPKADPPAAATTKDAFSLSKINKEGFLEKARGTTASCEMNSIQANGDGYWMRRVRA